MTFGLFLFGLILMVIGFLAVWKTYWFTQNLGEISDLLQFQTTRYVNWKTVGVVMMIIGFIIAFGLLDLFFEVVVSRFFTFGVFGQ